MIGAFARMLGSRSRVLSVAEDNAIRASSERGTVDHAAAPDAPPEAFTAKLSDEGGDVYLAPVLESLRAAVRARLGRPERDAAPHVSTTAPEGATSDRRTEGA